MIYSPADLLPYYGAHTAPYKAEVHRGNHKWLLIHSACGNCQGVIQAGFLPGIYQTLSVWLQVRKLQKIIGNNIVKQPGVSFVKHKLEILLGANTLMVLALRALVEILLEVFYGAGLVALFALIPQAVRGFLL